MRDLGSRATSCLAYHPQASKFTGFKNMQNPIYNNLTNESKYIQLTTELEWSLDERDKENVLEARAVLDSLDMDNDLEVFHFKVTVAKSVVGGDG